MGSGENEGGKASGWKKRRCEDGSERRRWYGGEPAMNDRNQRNTAPRKLPGIHPEYIIHTGVPARRPPRWVKGSRTPERTWPWRKRSVPVKSRTIGRAGASRGGIPRESRDCIHRDHPELFQRCFFQSSVQLRQMRLSGFCHSSAQ